MLHPVNACGLVGALVTGHRRGHHAAPLVWGDILADIFFLEDRSRGSFFLRIIVDLRQAQPEHCRPW